MSGRYKTLGIFIIVEAAAVVHISSHIISVISIECLAKKSITVQTSGHDPHST